MNTQRIFGERVQELEVLSERPKVFWYVSAGKDFRGPVFLTQHHIQHLRKHHGRELVKPELFVYTCLGYGGEKLKEKLSQGDGISLYSDAFIEVNGSNFKIIKMGDSFRPKPKEDFEMEIEHSTDREFNPDHIDIPVFEIIDRGLDVFYFELEIKGKDYTERQKVVYFEYENIDFFRKVILHEFFDVVYLCATREGIGYGGGCRKSIIDYIYIDRGPNFYIDKGFKTEFTILSNNGIKDFENGVKNSNRITYKKDYTDYIFEKDHTIHSPFDWWKDATIYKLAYPRKNHFNNTNDVKL